MNELEIRNGAGNWRRLKHKLSVLVGSSEVEKGWHPRCENDKIIARNLESIFSQALHVEHGKLILNNTL
jgi:hypothetical protein